MNFSTLIAILLLPTAAATDAPGQQMLSVSLLNAVEDTALHLDADGGLTLTESRWRSKCEDDWDNEDNGCAAMKKKKMAKSSSKDNNDDKKKKMAKSSSKDDNDDKKCDIDKKEPESKRGNKKYRFDLYKENATCRDKKDKKYEYGQYHDVKKFSQCADACVEKGPSKLLDDLKGFEWECKDKQCRCLYEEGTLRSDKYDFDSTVKSGRKGEGSIGKSSESDHWNCAKLSKSEEVLARVGRRALRGVN